MIDPKTALHKIPLFSTLSPIQLKYIIKSSRVLEYPKGQILFYEGDPGLSLLLILKGRVKIALLGHEGKQINLSILQDEFLGVMSLLDGLPRSATAIAIEPVVILHLCKADFHNLLQQHPKISEKVLHQLATWVRDGNQRLKCLGVNDRFAKILCALFQISKQNGMSHKNGKVTLLTNPSHQEIAEWAGCTRETASRAMKILEENKFIMRSGKGLILEPRAVSYYSSLIS